MGMYPPYIYVALNFTGPVDEEEIDAYVAAFVATWGSHETPSLLRALREGGEFDRLFAMWALAASRSTQAQEALQPFLVSDQPLERLASALALGKEYRDQRAVPTLRDILREQGPPYPDGYRVSVLDGSFSANDFYASRRRWIPRLLGDYGESESVPALRIELQAAVQQELAVEALARQPELGARYATREALVSERRKWIEYEDQLVYTLGRLGGLGALAGITGAETRLMRSPGLSDLLSPQSHLDQWRIQLILGSLHASRGQFTIEQGLLWEWSQTPALLQAVTRQLEQVFGLEPDAYRAALDCYAQEMGFTLAERYGWRRPPDAHLNPS
jgi:hypothetical protein